MSDKRRRYRKPKEERLQQARSITIARRQNDDSGAPKSSESEIQPKILLKPRIVERELREDEPLDSNLSENVQMLQRTLTAPRSEPSSSQVSIATKEQPLQQEPESVPMMTRPATILSSTGVISTNAKKLLKDNTDFFVVGVIGTQGVGKSSILNLLANDDCDYYQKIFLDEDGYFPTKLKQHKCPSRSRTESTHMFITPDRMILLDGAPVMCNSYKKDMTTNELDDLRSIVNFLSVCHLVIVVYTDHLNMNFMRLLRLAELMKPSQSNTNSLNDYYPNLLFVKNRAKRLDFSTTAQKHFNDMLEAFFHGSKMRIHRGQQIDHHLRSKKGSHTIDSDLSINSFIFPEVKGLAAVPFHKPLTEIIEDLRWLVFTTPRNEMSSSNAEFTEAAWFELFESVTQTTQHFFFNTYDEIHRSHLDVASGSNVHNVNGTSREIQDNWKD